MDKLISAQKKISEVLSDVEYYLVGGCVRDAVMGNEPKDFDICGPLLPDAIKSILESKGVKVFNVNGLEFGTVSFLLEIDGIKEQVEYTTYRSEQYLSKSRKPEVKFETSLIEDLKRRDFCFNAMVLKPDGKIFDPYGGKLDIYAKQIKTVGLPKDRIQEDPLRIFRAARFAARYDFKIDPNFIGKARQLADRIFDVSVERWVQEMDKLLTSEHQGMGIMQLRDMGVLQRILPEISAEFVTHLHTNNPDEAWKWLLSYVAVPEDVKEPSRTRKFINTGICSRFKFSNDRTDFILDKQKKKE